jgi:hypothetical protein
MKKIFAVLMILLLALFVSVPARAGDLTEKAITSTGACLVVATAKELFTITGLGGDSAANTLAVRALHFYNNVSVMVSDSPGQNFVMSITAPAGVYFKGLQFSGITYNKWGYPVFDGVTFSNGIVISPTAATQTFGLLVQYQ